MIDLHLYAAFVAAVTTLMFIPGPNVALIVANSVAHGARYGLLTVAGTSAAMVLHLAVTALGMSELLGTLGSWFEWIRWIGVAGFTPQPVAAYGAVTVMAAFGYIWLERELILAEGAESQIRAVVGSRKKEWVSFCLYALGIPAAFILPWIAIALYIVVSLMWLVPDRRFERWHNLQQSEAHPPPPHRSLREG